MEDEEFEDIEMADPIDLGPCCACRQEKPTVRNFMCIHKLAPVPGTGWGNVVYGWPCDGALAVVCDECAERETPLLDAISGHPMEKGRLPFSALQGEFGNNAPPDAAIYGNDEMEGYADEDDEERVPIVLFGLNGEDVTGMVELSDEDAAKLLAGGSLSSIYLDRLQAPSELDGNFRYILQDGKPVPEPNLEKWARWFDAHRMDMVVQQDTVGDVQICTVFLGLDYNYGRGNLELYETMFFGGPRSVNSIFFGGLMDMETKRYATVEEARIGHAEAVRWARLVESEGGEMR